MMNRRNHSAILALILMDALAGGAQATFHLMQIDQIIGGVAGNSAAQAIELRTRASFQNFVSGARLFAWDAAGQNPVLVLDIDANVSASASGIRILIASPEFLAATTPPAVADFVLTSLIPQSYLAAGSLTYEDDLGGIYWRVSWGGSAYTGPNDCGITNDLDGNAAPPFGSPLPSSSFQSLKFPGASNAKSTNNAADYAITATAAIFGNSFGATFTVTGPPPVNGDLDGDHDVDLTDFAIFSQCMPGPNDPIAPDGCNIEDFLAADLEHDTDVDLSDFAVFQNAFTGSQ
ncbi:MAG: hypothetical protein HY287_16260 [Planctomycetes bacterium]|nr:hypothetical protein [Planctomycetota bacterium]MBI3835880.1 hypothetical protein [Planctomycetota bacterium]